MSGYNPNEIPLESAPPGQVNNLVNGPSQAWIPRLAIYTTLPIAIGFLALRICARLRSQLSVGWDDFIAVCSLVASVGFCGVMLANVLNDTYGRHYWDIPLSAITATLLQETMAITAVYCCASLLIKMSLCFFFRRIFLPSPITHILTLLCMLVSIASYTAFFIAWIYYSVPRSGETWTSTTYFTRVEVATPKLSVGLGVVSVFTDFFIFVIPLLAISRLNMSNARKYGVSALFATGLLACSFSIASLVSRFGNYRATLIEGRPDPFWTSMTAYGLAVAELNLGIICACVPPAFPLLKSFAEMSSSRLSSWKTYRLRSSSPTTPKRSGNSEDSTSAIAPGLQGMHNNTTNMPVAIAQIYKNSTREDGILGGGITVTQAIDIEMGPYSVYRSSQAGSMYQAYTDGNGSRRHLVHT